jgi:predicted  nucleic acid-binding Zn-ribbon protein
MENKTIHELAKENPDKTYSELTEMQENSRPKQEVPVIKKDHVDSSPEMRDAKKEITKLKKEICELRQDNRRLAHEVEDKVNRMRKSGL